MRLSYCATTKGSRSNLQAAIKSPPARSSSQTSNRVPLQSALKAIQSHQPLRPIELAFQVGDIFQVKGECVEPDGSVWLDVMSPVSGLRGIVPLQKFRIISLPKPSAHEHPSQPQLNQQSHPSPQHTSSDEKFLHSRSLQRIRKRLSSHSTLNPPLKSPPATIAENATPGSGCPPEAFPFPSVDQSSPKPPPTRNRRSLTLSSAKLPAPPGYSPSPRMRFLSQSGQANPPASTQKPPVELNSPVQLTKPSQLLYGVVKHSFNPESDHELKAHAGEPIIINAYSELGWFVCKPISRLGGPGLLPVSHVQVRDVTTGTELSPENLEHFARSSGLPRVNEWEEATAAYLCRSIPLGSFESPVVPPPKEVLPTVTLSEPAKSLYTDPKKLMASSELVREWQRRQMEDTLIIEPQVEPRQSLYDPIAPRSASHGTFVVGTAESLTEAQGEFWFTLKVKFAYPNESELSMKSLVVHRSYEELLKFDQSLQSRLRSFSATIAEEFQMPWLMEHVTANMVDQQFCSYQLDELNSYLCQLSQASLEIRELVEVYDFLGPRQSDLELEENMKSRIHEEAIFQYLDQMALSSSKYDLHDNPAKSSPSPSQSTFADQTTASPVFDNFSFHRHHSDPSSDYLPSTPSSTKFKACSSPLTKNPARSYYNSDGQITKMKICHLQSNDVIAIKVSSSIALNDLTTKIRSRYNETCSSSGHFGDDYFGDRTVRLKYLTVDSLDQSCIDFDDCDSSADESDVVPPHLGPGTFVRITSDAQLRKWIDTEKKLVLYI
ncbi:hypothetical protein PGT21_036767 [Puccinia graminis f. sp. tritici]|uniref:SH3 domain-containing protein n=1 Tax=Puccinia graminis f. sp. tritici TaxID=56615 RepID=A0A5B0Q0P5_PUCGR|nr:hypothetical protein PGT21_036767 [Puccinia graminis f. sp. tritici]KAA1126158.1 hypothetical protein PGTUg99_002991 [Puccinia graminis f. sp. tritici]